MSVTLLVAKNLGDAQWAIDRGHAPQDSVIYLSELGSSPGHGRTLDIRDRIVYVDGWREGRFRSIVEAAIFPMAYRVPAHLIETTVQRPPTFQKVAVQATKRYAAAFGMSFIGFEVIMSECPVCLCAVFPGREEDHFQKVHKKDSE